MTSTSRRLFALSLLVLLFASMVSASHYYQSSTDYSSFSVPQYDSGVEILTELIAPFLLIVIPVQIGLQRALHFTMADDDPWSQSNNSKRVRKQSTIIALAIGGVIVPTPFFQTINEVTAIVFGGMFYLMMFLIAGVVLYLIFKALG